MVVMRAATLFASLLILVSCGDSGSGGAGASGGSPAQGGGGAGATGGTGAPEGTGGTGAPDGTGGTGAPGEGGVGGVAPGGSGGGGAAPDFYGLISGTCGTIDLTDIQSPDAQIVDNELDLTGRPAFDPSLLTEGGQAIYDAGNLGGSSLYSEIFAFEVLNRCEGAAFEKSEGEIVYAIEGKKTDILVSFEGEKVGVSVVRAVSFPEGSPYPESQAKTVIEGKLADILLSSANVAPVDAWQKQILAVVAQTPEHAASVEAAWQTIDPAIRADTIVYVTVTEGDDDFIYYNQ
jgi:hypothetical protein